MNPHIKYFEKQLKKLDYALYHADRRNNEKEVRDIVMYQVVKSGYPYELPPLVMPENVPDYREFAWEALLDGYAKVQIAKAMGRSENYVNKLLQGRKKVMPRLVTRWIRED